MKFRPHSSWRLRLRLYDKLTLGFLFVYPMLALLAGKASSLWPFTAIAHTALILLALAAIRWENSLPQSLRWLRDWYPLAGFTFFFSEVGRIVTVFFPFWLEVYLVETDHWLFGEEAWKFFTAHLNAVTTEILAFAYWSYFLLIPFVAWLYYRQYQSRLNENQLHKPDFESVMNRLCTVMFSCYTCFLLMPARGPHHMFNLSHAQLFSGGWFWQNILFIQSQSAVVGAAFPSSHAAAAWAVLLPLRKNFRKIFWMLLPIVVLLSISTFALQYHYAVDALAGFMVALAFEWAFSRSEAPKQGVGHESKKIKARARQLID